MDRRAFLRTVAGAATLPLLPVQAAIQHAYLPSRSTKFDRLWRDYQRLSAFETKVLGIPWSRVHCVGTKWDVTDIHAALS